MTESAAQGLAMFGLLGTLFLVVLAILWVLVPFAVFGIKSLLKEHIHQQQITNALLSDLIANLNDAPWSEAAQKKGLQQ